MNSMRYKPRPAEFERNAMNTNQIQSSIRSVRADLMWTTLGLLIATAIMSVTLVFMSMSIRANTQDIDSLNLRLQNYGIATGLVEEPSDD